MDTSTARAEHSIKLVGAELVVAEGADQGARVRVGSEVMLIGRGPECQLRLRDPLVSQRHLRVSPHASGIAVEDLESRNGTFHGNVRVTNATVTGPTTLRLGGTALTIRPNDAPLELELSRRLSFGSAIGESAAMRHVFYQLEQVARSETTVLLEGESGTGKDVLARSLHGESDRRDGEFVVVDCSTLPDHLVESELFGHERGAFTGATSARRGAFELAEGGTLFLDEVGDLPVELQPKLLRVLESRRFRRVGGSKEIEANVRIVSATNRPLAERVKQGEFREDLFYRISVIRIVVPPLRDRVEDVVPLARLFLSRFSREPTVELSHELEALLVTHDWPGNVRELRNAIERFLTFGCRDVDRLMASHRSGPERAASIDIGQLDGLPYHEAKRRLLESFHRELLPTVLKRAGSVTRTAELLELPRPSVSRMLRRLKNAAE